MAYTAGYKKKDEQYLKDLVLLSIPDRPCNISSRKISQNTGVKDTLHSPEVKRRGIPNMCNPR